MPEAVVFCGIQGSGKTTFYASRFAATHAHVSRDVLRTRNREREAIEDCIASGRSFVVDNTNATREHRAPYVAAALAAGYDPVAYWLDVRPSDAIDRNHTREGRARIPVKGILGTYERLQVPKAEEGFSTVYRVLTLPDRRFEVHPLDAAVAGQQLTVL
jgi:predicted kinase